MSRISASVCGATVNVGNRAAKRASPQDAHGVFPERVAHVPQHACTQVGHAAVRVDELRQIG